ncbi:MAG: hypothetical protein FWF77_02190 [Defluviitaleaceae bacterium]|nr:hypothetical protein [Defluviitaleaceae bacterium]
MSGAARSLEAGGSFAVYKKSAPSARWAPGACCRGRRVLSKPEAVSRSKKNESASDTRRLIFAWIFLRAKSTRPKSQ